ncbi:chemotaxis protein CheA [Erythrobacter sp. SCSIO 43205]|uniref:chemotaxis protein CheA n=1 Tax=Erythrobacter sp. SCSIO 43205 TaxID=2779361 RepID=UPI001CA8C573|nr:chemotaxis protein CheA [Erythrobacter sp. SCSIO 43205]UAB79554.1 chemotaxis protein CheA [Erythrobacter sp. SCSIO 43205]
MNDDDIQQIFFVECEEALEATENGLNACANGTNDDETINAIFRGVHSIKGGAGAFGHTALASYTHCFENLLGDIREGVVVLTPELTDLLLLACDLLRDHVEAARGAADVPDDAALMQKLEAARAGGAASSEDQAGEAAPGEASEPPTVGESDATEASASDDLDLDLDALLDDIAGAEEAPQAEPEKPSWLVHIRPHAGSMDNGGEPLLWLRELASLGGTCEACQADDLPAIDDLIVDEGYLGWTFRMPGSVDRGEVEEIFDFAGDDCGLAFDNEPFPPLRLSDQAPVEATQEAPDSGPAGNPTSGAAQSPSQKAPSAEQSAQPAPAPAPASAPVAAPTPSSTNPKAEQAKAEQAKAEPAKPSPEAAPETQEKTPAKAASTAGQSVRIDLAKLDRLIDGVGELVIAQAMLAQRLENENVAHIEELAMLDTLIRDIQEHAMAFRAQPISSVFGRVPRLLRELASNTGKHVKLDVSGESTELDKTVIERLSEPMTHLIRNAVDHGIEAPEDRKAAGKDPEGTLSLSAEQKAGRVVIHIKDDGRGINREKVLAKAIENGIIAEDANLTDDEICQLIFAPGFSTAASVTSVSGRGVGMDVVKSNVRDLGGRITIESVEGEGTTFSLALPLTLAISDGMIVQAGDLSLVVPLTHVIESLKPTKDDLKGMGTNRMMLNVRGRFVPVVSLGALTGANNWIDDPCKGVIVLVETEGHGQAALLVDTITDQRQFVIKSLDANFRAVDGVAGATILGNGKVSLIVDVDHMVQAGSAASMAMAA